MSSCGDVMPISVDGIDSHVAWASEMSFPFALLSDTAQVVATTYGSILPGEPYDNRTVFVVGRDGRISYRGLRFGALGERAYRELAHAVVRFFSESIKRQLSNQSFKMIRRFPASSL